MPRDNAAKFLPTMSVAVQAPDSRSQSLMDPSADTRGEWIFECIYGDL